MPHQNLSSTKDFWAGSKGFSAAAAPLERSVALLERVADLERAYRRLLRSCSDNEELADRALQFEAALEAAVGVWLDRGRLHKSFHVRPSLVTAVPPGFTPTNPPI